MGDTHTTRGEYKATNISTTRLSTLICKGDCKPYTIKAQGLCYSEIVNLITLLKKANPQQILKILESDTQINSLLKFLERFFASSKKKEENSLCEHLTRENDQNEVIE